LRSEIAGEVSQGRIGSRNSDEEENRMRWSPVHSFRALWDSLAYGLSLTFDLTQFLLVLLSVWIFFSCITGRAQAPGFPG
jgi:hypothetical protein